MTIKNPNPSKTMKMMKPKPVSQLWQLFSAMMKKTRKKLAKKLLLR